MRSDIQVPNTTNDMTTKGHVTTQQTNQYLSGVMSENDDFIRRI